jgi:hypothetical protein
MRVRKVSCFPADKTEGDMDLIAFLGTHVSLHFQRNSLILQ